MIKYFSIAILTAFFTKCMINGITMVDVAALAVLSAYSFFNLYYVQSKHLSDFEKDIDLKLKQVNDNLIMVTKTTEENKLAVATLKMTAQKRVF